LSTHLKEKEEKILQVLERLAKESLKGTLIIVEGKKDVESLRALGIEGKIIASKAGGRSRLDLLSQIESMRSKEIILLFDFDRTGGAETAYMKQQLEKSRIKANSLFRAELIGLVGREVKDIEGLDAYIATLREKTDKT
jgi:2,5-diamino-6-(ribosylamino)-4(3H)-pyrimidinone 5'-phosphate reductase